MEKGLKKLHWLEFSSNIEAAEIFTRSLGDSVQFIILL